MVKTKTAVAIAGAGIVVVGVVAAFASSHHRRVQPAAAAASPEPIDPTCRERCGRAGDKEAGAWSGAQELEAKARAVDVQMCESQCDIDRKLDRIDKQLGR